MYSYSLLGLYLNKQRELTTYYASLPDCQGTEIPDKSYLEFQFLGYPNPGYTTGNLMS